MIVSTGPEHTSSSTRGQRRASKALVGIVIVAVALRVLSALYHGDAVSTLPGIHDQISYDTLARRVLAGDGFSFPANWWPMTSAGQPTAHWSFLYTLYLAAVYALFGPHPLVARLIQAAIAGVLYPWLMWRIGGRTFGRAVGIVAAGIVAVYAYFVYYAGALMTETFYILAILWAIDLATGIACDRGTKTEDLDHRSRAIRKTVKPWLTLGLALGIAVSLRQVILLFVPFLFVWLLWAAGRRRGAGKVRELLKGQRSVIAGMLVAGLVLVAMIVPWTVRNYYAFDRFVLLNTNVGYAFFWANHPIHGTDFVPILPSSTYRDLVPRELRGMDEAALDQALLREGLRFVVEDPLRYGELSLSRIAVYFQFWPSAESSLVSNLARVFSFGIMLPLMLYGLLLPIVRRRGCVRADQGATVVLLYQMVGVYTLIHLLSWALIRYRLPVDAIMILFAALASVDLRARLERGSRPRFKEKCAPAEDALQCPVESTARSSDIVCPGPSTTQGISRGG